MKKSKLIKLLERENNRLESELKILNNLFLELVIHKKPAIQNKKVEMQETVENCETVAPIEIIKSIGKTLTMPIKLTKRVNVSENTDRCKYLYEIGYRLKSNDILTPTGRKCFNSLNRIHYKSSEGRQLSVKFQDFMDYCFKLEKEKETVKIKNLPPQNLVASHK